MSRTIQREMLLPQPMEQVWHAIADSAALADWMFPNDFQPRLGHRFAFHVPPNPAARFDGMVIQCEVLECQPPTRLAFSWSAAGLVDSRVTFRLEPDAAGTKLFFEHSGFDDSFPPQAFKGAEYGWKMMLDKLPAVAARTSNAKEPS